MTGFIIGLLTGLSIGVIWCVMVYFGGVHDGKLEVNAVNKKKIRELTKARDEAIRVLAITIGERDRAIKEKEEANECRDRVVEYGSFVTNRMRNYGTECRDRLEAIQKVLANNIRYIDESVPSIIPTSGSTSMEEMREERKEAAQ